MGEEVCVGVRRVCGAGVCDRRDCCWGVETCWQVRATDDYCDEINLCSIMVFILSFQICIGFGVDGRHRLYL